MTVAWCFEDQSTPYTENVLESLAAGEAVVPALWPLEVANALVRAERRGRLAEAKCVAFLNRLRRFAIVIDGEGPGRAFEQVLSLAREHQLSAYDAAYLDLAMREDLPLATVDEPLAKVARKLGLQLTWNSELGTRN